MKISAIIPAYNEADTIGDVVDVLSHIKEIDEIIVVSDGSEDDTVSNAKSRGAKVIELTTNIGKGGAMKVGLDNCSGDVVLFLDADLIGLTEGHIKRLLTPVITEAYEMTIGIFDGGRFRTDLAQWISPFLSGQRAVRKEMLANLCNMEISKFGIEVVLTNYVKRNNIPYKKVFLQQMSHVMKEEKLGIIKGLHARMKMYWEILKGIALVSKKM